MSLRIDFVLVWFTDTSAPPVNTHVKNIEDSRRIVPVPLVLHYALNGESTISVQRAPVEYIDCKIIQDMLRFCEEAAHHSNCTADDLDLPNELRLIDVQDMRIVSLSEHGCRPRFVALSYVWAMAEDSRSAILTKTNSLSLKKPGALIDLGLPPLIHDSIVLCRDIGERFLWVDRLCIIQDDEQDLRSQINAMDKVYACANFTLVLAMSGTSGSRLPGVNRRPRLHYSKEGWSINISGYLCSSDYFGSVVGSPWSLRAWTFQEAALSHRCIIITDHRWYLACAYDTYMEDHGWSGPIWQLSMENSNPIAQLTGRGVNEFQHIDFVYAVQQYITRNITFEADAVRAFTGFGNAASAQLGTRFHHGLLESCFPDALFWRYRELVKRREAPDIPSWSWAAWEGSEFNGGVTIQDKNKGQIVRFYIMTASHDLMQMDTPEYWFDTQSSRDQTHASRPPNQSGTGDDWEQCPHNRHHFLHPEVLMQDQTTVAQSHVGALVFNSTVATVTLKVEAHRIPSEDRTEDALIMCKGQPVGTIELGETEFFAHYIDISKEYKVVVMGAAKTSQES